MNRSIFLKKKTFNPNIKSMVLNFGPNHPAAHGVLRMILQLNNEIIENVDTHIGLLHRGTEKLIESKPYILSIPYFDRLDYISMLSQEHAYCLAIENLITQSKFLQSYAHMRVLFDELTRILNHFMAIGSHTIDIGAMAPIFWGFEEREKIMEFYERISGARMHAAFYKPNYFNYSGCGLYLFTDILFFLSTCYITTNEIHNLVIYNKIWKQRLVNIGIVNLPLIHNYGLTGVFARSAGYKIDVRLSITDSYASYNQLSFRSFHGTNGDSYDRYLLRIQEIIESLNIANQILNTMFANENEYHYNLLSFFLKKFQKNPYKNMEALIRHFKYWSEGIRVEKGQTYTAIESPKGEFGVFLISDSSNIPYRCKVRSPAYFNLYALKKLLPGSLFADLITLIGSVDIVFGEIDR